MLPFGQRQRLLLARDISHMNAPGTDSPRLRRQCLARTAHAADGDSRLSRIARSGRCADLAPVLGEMRAQSKRMGQIVEDLLTLSRLETQDHVSDERVPMAPLLATCARKPKRSARAATDHDGIDGRTGSARLAEGSAQRAVQPGQQRSALHADRRQHHHSLANARPKVRQLFGDDTGFGIPAAPVAAHRALLSRFVEPFARQRRHWLGSVDRQTRAEPASGAVCISSSTPGRVPPSPAASAMRAC
jgi:two-component system phosphate regulon sensor histidine kinase PhoR